MLGLPRLRLPRPDRIPSVANLRTVPPIDTGGVFRPDWREQDPSKDPREPFGNEASGTGTDHGWSNCTMGAAALAYAYAVQDASGPYPGDMRHNQDDLSGGTDLYDADTAFHRFGNQDLTIMTGSGWESVKKAHNEGRAIVIQGEGNVPGSESFDGGHACVIGPETHSSGDWLFGDPLASGWQWVSPSSIKDWADNLSTGIYFAVTKLPPSEGGDMPGPKFSPAQTIGTATVIKDGVSLIATSDGEYHPVPKGYVRNVAGLVTITDGGHKGAAAYLVSAGDGESGLLLASDSTYVVADDPEGLVETRDEEWRDWLLSGSPGMPDE